VFAPGLNILSSCAHVVCGDDSSYWSLSGTSMACPHVSGVVAQLLQKHPTATPLEIFDYLSCDAVPNILHLDTRDTISKDLLLQSPRRADSGTEDCNPGIGCPAQCSNVGVCLPDRLNQSKHECYCDGGYYGPSCSAPTDPLCTAAHYSLVVDMLDSYGDGWTFTNFVVQDATTLEVVDGAYNSLCYDAEDKATYCLPRNQCYIFDVNRGYFPQEVGWTMCGVSGGAPSSQQFCVSAAGVCSAVCSASTKNIPLLLEDAYGDGWEGAYYAIYDPATGEQDFGGTLVDGLKITHNICMPLGGCYVLLMEQPGDHGQEVSISVCGQKFGSDAAVRICLNSAGTCTVSSLHTEEECVDSNDVEVLMFADGSAGWEGASISVMSDPVQSNGTDAVVATATLDGGFEGSVHMCVPDGCFDFDTITSGDANVDSKLFWLACGELGKVPASRRLCVNYELGLCYGLSGCSTAFSSAHYRYRPSVICSITPVDRLYCLQ
jgi:hypothetical protein